VLCDGHYVNVHQLFNCSFVLTCDDCAIIISPSVDFWGGRCSQPNCAAYSGEDHMHGHPMLENCVVH